MGQTYREIKETPIIETISYLEDAVDTRLTVCNITPEFIRAGKAIFTVDNGRGQHYTFKVTKSEPSAKYPKPSWFVGLLTGPDNSADYTYLGILTKGAWVNSKGQNFPQRVNRVMTTRATKLSPTSTPIQVFNFAMRVVDGHQELLPGYRIQHSGHCGMCGRRLTEPESLETGLGPVCREK